MTGVPINRDSPYFSFPRGGAGDRRTQKIGTVPIYPEGRR